MFNFNLLTGPLFTAGVLHGVNKRAEKTFQPDIWAHYKLMGIGIGMSAMKSIENYYQDNPLQTKSSLKSHLVGGGLIGGILVTGTAYCMGLLLTKIPSKSTYDL